MTCFRMYPGIGHPGKRLSYDSLFLVLLILLWAVIFSHSHIDQVGNAIIALGADLSQPSLPLHGIKEANAAPQKGGDY